MQLLLKLTDSGYEYGVYHNLRVKLENFAIDYIKKNEVKHNLMITMIHSIIDSHYNICGNQNSNWGSKYLVRAAKLIEKIYGFNAEDEFLQKQIFTYFFKVAQKKYQGSN